MSESMEIDDEESTITNTIIEEKDEDNLDSEGGVDQHNWEDLLDDNKYEFRKRTPIRPHGRENDIYVTWKGKSHTIFI